MLTDDFISQKFHLSHCINSFAKSQIGSDIQPHWEGYAPPNVIQSAISGRTLNMVMLFTAVSAEKWA